MIEKKIPTIAKNDRPIIVWRICRPVRRSFSCWNRPISKSCRPNDLDKRMPLTLKVSSVTAVRSAIVRAVVVATLRRAPPTLKVSQTKIGRRNSDRIVSVTDIQSMTASVEMITTMFDTTEAAVSVTTLWTPLTSFDTRDWISPVRVVVKKRSGIRCRCR